MAKRTADKPHTRRLWNYGVRIQDRDGEPWFLLADVCQALGVTNQWNAAARLDDDEKSLQIVETLGGPQQTTVINESGLYSLILTCRKPTAKRFKKWVTAVVLPSIRKHGSYIAGSVSV